MSEKQKQAIEKLSEKIGSWNDEQKSYLLGYIDGVTQSNQQEEKKKEA
jgi:hypothetical protein